MNGIVRMMFAVKPLRRLIFRLNTDLLSYVSFGSLFTEKENFLGFLAWKVSQQA